MDSEQYPHLAKGIVCALTGGIFWGFSANCAEYLMQAYGVSVLWMSAVRISVSALFFLGFSFLVARDALVSLLKNPKDLLQAAAFGVFGVMSMQMTYLLAIEVAGAGTALTLEQLALVFIMLWVCLKDRRLPRRREFFGLVFAILGVLCIATQGTPSTLSISPTALFWGLASAVTMAAYNLIPVRLLDKYGTPIVNGVGMFFGSIACMAICRPWEFQVELPWDGWLALAGLVVVGTIIAYFLYVQGIRYAGPVRASLLGCVEPVSGTLIAALWIGTMPTIWDLAGLAFIIVMIFLETLKEDGGKDGLPEGQ